MRWKLQVLTRQIPAILLIFLAILSCGRAKEEPATKEAQDLESSIPSGAVTAEDENQASLPLLDEVHQLAEWGETVEGENQASSSSPTLPVQQSPVTTELLTSSARSTVIIGGDLGLTVSGEGTGDPNRSSAELEQQLRTFLPQLREVYDQELTRDPHSMGSLDVKMTIEPSGSVSELRFPLKRVSSERLTSAVYDAMRAWQFSSAERPVDIRYRMILVPAGMDPASIGRWERHLADRIEVDQSEKVSPTVAPRRTLGHLLKEYGFDRSEKVSPTVAPAEVTPNDRVPARQQEAESPRRFLAQWYHVTRPTVLYATPNSSAAVVTRLQPGKHIWVIGMVDGEWLEVRSVKGRRPGFLPRKDAQPERRERARR